MDIYEEDANLPQPQPEEAEQPQTGEELQQEPPAVETAAPADGFYHGTGVGETVVLSDSAAVKSPAPDVEANAKTDNGTDTPAAASASGKKKRHLGIKIFKCAVASILIVALVSAACGISIVVTNQHWQIYNQRLLENFEAQIQVLRQELAEYEKNDSAPIIVPTEGLTPSQVYEKNLASVVAVNCIVRSSNNGQMVEGVSSGSGFVLTSDGYIVTNHHVVEGSSSISVSFADGRQYTAQMIGSDAINDIALLHIVARELQPVTIGSSSDLRVGDQVVAIGNALGELSFSLTVGYVSGTDRSIATDGSITNMIQTDASINSGNSGGPLFNARGEVVGITTAKYSGTSSSGASIEGVGFALPIDDVIGMLEDLRQYGYITGAYMGVMVRDVDPDAAEMYGFPVGAYVMEATAGFAAQKAGIRAKDIITNVGGYNITCMSDLTRALRNFKAGEQSTVVVWRAGQRLVLNIVFDEKPQG